MEYPIIKQININADFKYLWLKYVDGYDLNNHCAKSLIGNYSNKIINKKTSYTNLVLDEFDSRVYYLCGVSLPFNYDKNFHLAFKFQMGSKISINENGIEITIENAERVRVKPELRKLIKIEAVKSDIAM